MQGNPEISRGTRPRNQKPDTHEPSWEEIDREVLKDSYGISERSKGKERIDPELLKDIREVMFKVSDRIQATILKELSVYTQTSSGFSTLETFVRDRKMHTGYFEIIDRETYNQEQHDELLQEKGHGTIVNFKLPKMINTWW